MNGLEQIVLTIKQKAEEQSAQIIASAEEKAAQIKAEAGKTAEAECEKIILDAKKKCEQNVEAAKSAAVSNGLKELLKFKSQTVAGVISDTEKKLRELPDNEYFEVIEKLILANMHKGENGKLMFGEKDAKRVPAGFVEKINKAAENINASVTLGENADISDGFILSYGDIEENCSFGAIVSSKEDALKDEIASILFG